jgi:hypothetical protein
VGRVGVPQAESIPEGVTTFFDNVTIAGGPAPARAYIEELFLTFSKAGSTPAESSTA